MSYEFMMISHVRTYCNDDICECVRKQSNIFRYAMIWRIRSAADAVCCLENVRAHCSSYEGTCVVNYTEQQVCRITSYVQHNAAHHYIACLYYNEW